MNFDYQGYDLKFIQCDKCRDESPHLYTKIYKFFSPVTHYSYILRADYHKFDVYAIKFYCKRLRHSDFKYSKITNKGDLGNIIVTCLKVIPILLKEQPSVSFAFAGARTIDSQSSKVENYENTQRYRVYEYIVSKKIGTQIFSHFSNEQVSSYLLLNKQEKNIKARKEAIENMFKETYDDLHNI